MGYELDKEIMILPGNFSFLISKNCNLHCHYCGHMDYNGLGEGTIEKSMNLDDIKTIEKKILDLGLKFNQIEVFGGEPTINPQFDIITEYLSTRRGILYDKLKLFTNGLNMTKRVGKVLKYYDHIDFSIYPITSESVNEYQKVWNESKISNNLKNTFIMFHTRHDFYHTIEWELPVDADIQKIFGGCFLKDNCRMVTVDGIYRCSYLHHEKTEIYKFDRKILEEKFITNPHEPPKYCSQCHVAKGIYLQQEKTTNPGDISKIGPLQWENQTDANIKPWVSRNLKVDKRNYKRGIELLKNYG